MGNKQVVYEEGKYIIPKIVKKEIDVLEGKHINMENLFGKIDIPSARAHRDEE